ncbi:zinc finger protein dhhc domain containing protein [Sarocladium implicatum]|nr:zinc finger protein dhhc domain containing protein [Sarocladium implicatum]
MSDRYYAYGHNGRPLSYNPATSSVPSGIGYTGSGSMYSGDAHITPSASSSSRHHVTPRGYYTSNPTGGVPTTTRTFAVNHDPRSRPSRETSRTRRSTLDSTSRPPVIVTTSSHKDRANAASSHSSGTRSGHSPNRDDLYYGQNSPNSRPSRHHRTYSANYDDDYSRHRDTSLSRRDAEAYRNSRPSVVYPSDPRHSTAAVDFGSGDYGTDGYQYTNAGELARYDLDNPRASRRRRDSVDRGYYRPSLSYNPDQRSLNVNTSPDLSRNYTSNTSRLYDGRGGPPPSTRGFDRINSRWEDPEPRSASGAAPSSSTPGSTFEVAGGPGRRSRPTSMYADGAPRSGLPDDYYRRDDDRVMRDPRDREPDRPASSAGYHDSGVSSRGFGLRTGPPPGVDPQDRRREPRQEQPAKRSDESLKRDSDHERRERHGDRQEGDDPRRERREARKPSDEEEKERTRLRDKVTGGLGIAAAAVGLSPSILKDDDKEKEKEKEREPRRRPSPDEDYSTRKEMPPIEPKAPVPEPSERERKPSDEDLSRQPPPVDPSVKDRMRRDAEARLNGEAVAPASGSESDEGKRARRRHRPSHNFNPNDTTDLTKLKEQLAAMKVSEKGREREDPTTSRDETPRPPSPRNEIAVVEASRDDSRGRELSVSSESKQVRLVSPPRDKKGDKPVRGILKAPSAAFPEEANPIREGVAPHKEDKKLKEVPAGARWTKISRRKVNPEALEFGKERFEVRDDFVIVLRVLSAEEIQAYATATQILRDRRRKDRDGRDPDKAREEGEEDESKRRHHRHHDADDDADRERDRERDSERRSRRHKRSGEDDEYDTSDQPHHHHHHSHHQRSFRERERERGRDREWAVES